MDDKDNKEETDVKKEDGQNEQNDNAEYEKILLNIEPLNPFFKPNDSRETLLEQENDKLNVLVFKRTDLKILYEIFPHWKNKYFKVNEFISNYNNLIGDKIKNKEEEKEEKEEEDPEMESLRYPLNTKLPWQLNCYRWPGPNYNSHVELYWAMITIQTLYKYPKIEFTFFDEKKYLNDMIFNWSGSIKNWQNDLKKMRPAQFPQWTIDFEKIFKNEDLLVCLKNNIYHMDLDKITPLHKAENKFMIDCVLKILFPQAEIFSSASEMWLQLKKSHFKSNPKDISNSMLKNLILNSQTRSYHIRHWIDKVNSFPKCIDLAPYPDKAFVEELILKCQICYGFDDDELLNQVKISKTMPLNDIIQRIDQYNSRFSNKQQNSIGSANDSIFPTELSTLTNSNSLESRINTSSKYRITKPKHTISSNNGSSAILSLGNRPNSSLQHRKSSRSKHTVTTQDSASSSPSSPSSGYFI